MNRIYLDYAASTPVDRRVLEAMTPYFSEKFGNPGSLHSFGQEAIAAVDESREKITKSIGADFREIIFTGSATEANNTALRGVVGSVKCQVSSVKDKSPRIIVSSIEHESVLETARDLEKDGVEVVYLPVDRNGVVNLKKIEESLNDCTVLVSVMYANNEIGTIQPISKISEIIRNFREKLETRNEKLGVGSSSSLISHLSHPLLHTDAAQAFQFLDCDVNKLGVDLMTLSAHKIYGPKGVGALYVRQKLEIRNEKLGIGSSSSLISHISSLTSGGGQEFGLRSGTENVPSIVGFAKAVELVSNSRELENKRIAGLRDYFWQELKKICADAEVNGSCGSRAGYISPTTYYLPNILNVYFPNYLADELLTKFNLAGLAVSSGSACRSRAVESSYVIGALGYDKERAKNSIRFSFGRPTTKEELDRALEIIRMKLK
ncbi:MAG: cysteine desulfurase [Candidatus Liptonbacteria bacterium]|nr:cysteine desulfurase [Parcubacteria group bacterium]MBI4087370.1 cysteine desulfurase [Candidatus Liptonbacteria bacterium]